MSATCWVIIKIVPIPVPAEIRVYEQEVIIVPTLLLAIFLITIVFIFLLRFCPEKVDRIRPQALKSASRRVLHGIDGKTLEQTVGVDLNK